MSKTNPYLNWYSQGNEQALIENLIIESIKFYGHTVHYIKRDDVNIDPLAGDDVLKQYTEVYDIEIYIKNIDGYEGDGHFLANMMLEIRDSATLTMSKTRFQHETGHTMERPREGDLVYVPLTGTLLEIKYATDKNLFFQLGALHTFDIKVELFEFSQEKIQTGYEEIDTIADILGYSVTASLGAGTGTYVDDEMVYQGANLATSTFSARISTVGTGVLALTDIKGVKTLNASLIGNTSNASYLLTEFDEMDDVNNPVADNKEIETKAENLIDFSEKDPFSKGNY